MADTIVYPEEEDFKKDEVKVMRKLFRRSSFEFGFVRAEDVLNILHSMGQLKVDEKQLQKCIKELDPLNTGTLGFEEYREICRRFIKEPMALAKADSDDFSFAHLIHLTDFAHA